jgi:site-specific recombinase XerD
MTGKPDRSVLLEQPLPAENGEAIAQIIGKGGKRCYMRISAQTWQVPQALDIFQGKENYICPNLKAGKAMSHDGIAKAVQRCGRLIGVQNISPHILRHSHATHAVRRGVPLDLIRNTLGHTSLNTNQIYLKANPSDANGLHLGV